MPLRWCAVLAVWVAACGGGNGPADAGLDSGSALDANGGADASAPPDASADSGSPFDPACIGPAIMAETELEFGLPMMAGSSGPLSYVICPDGTNPSSSPLICILETQITIASFTPTVSASQVTLVGTMPLRVQDVPAQIDLGVCTPTLDFAIDGDGSCPGGTYAEAPIAIDIAINVAQGNSLRINQVFDDAMTGSNLMANTSRCGAGATCPGTVCDCALASADLSAVRTDVLQSILSVLRSRLASQIETQICAHDGSCPTGTTADDHGLCRYPDMSCAPGPLLFLSGC